MKQVELQRDKTKIITWVDEAKEFKVGDRLTLKGYHGEWVCKEIFTTDVPKDQINSNRTWDAGGLV